MNKTVLVKKIENLLKEIENDRDNWRGRVADSNNGRDIKRANEFYMVYKDFADSLKRILKSSKPKIEKKDGKIRIPMNKCEFEGSLIVDLKRTPGIK